MNAKKPLIALSAAIVLGALATVAQAADSGEYDGGFVMPGSMDGVNPAYHPNLVPGYHKEGNDRDAYGYANEGNTDEAKVPGYDGAFINGDFIPRGTSPAQIPSHHEEDDYGSEAGKE